MKTRLLLMASMVCMVYAGVGFAQQTVVLVPDYNDCHDDVSGDIIEGPDSRHGKWRKRHESGRPTWGIAGDHNTYRLSDNIHCTYNEFPGLSGTYAVSLGAVIEEDGNGEFELEIDGGVAVHDRYPWHNGSNNCGTGTTDRMLDLGEHQINNGDEIIFRGTTVYPCGDHGQYTRWWQLVFEFQGSADDDTPPSAPSNLTTTAAGNNALSFSWDASDDSESGIKEYRLYFDGDHKATVNDASATVTGLTRNTEYSNIYVVAINNADLTSEQSNAISATTADDDVASGTFYLCAAEDAASMANGMEAVSQSGSECAEVIRATNDGGNTDLSDSDSRAQYNITVASGEWYLWGRTKFTEDAGNSWWVTVDGNSIDTRFVNEPPVAGVTDDWHWEGEGLAGPVPLGSLSEGSHVVAVYAREAADDSFLDQLCFTQDANYDPSGAVAKTVRSRAARPGRSNQIVKIYSIDGKLLATPASMRTRALDVGSGVTIQVGANGKATRRITRPAAK
jgi:hypothetical protein